MKQVIEQLLDGQDLTRNQAYETMESIMSGRYSDPQIAGFLIALRAKGETVEEIVGFAQAMREKMVVVSLSTPAIDLCGTGGDVRGTFNISTAASFVVAGAGVKVAKHGNRSMTSKSGSADVLHALGIPIHKPPEKTVNDVEQSGLGFLFAPDYHPAMKYAIGARKALATRTVFNLLGPLCNPAQVRSQIMGISQANFVEIQARVLQTLGADEALVFHGQDGLDELSTTANTTVYQVRKGKTIHSFELDARNLGLPRATLKDLAGGTPEENASIISAILTGAKGPKRDIVLLNAAAGIVVGQRADDLLQGLEMATESVDSGAALEVLNRLAQ